MHNSLDVAQLSADAADNKKALDILILDLRSLTYITDYFIICSASNSSQVGAIADGITEALAKAGVHPSHIEGEAQASWVLMDYGDIVVHIFNQETRSYYSLEKLWGDAPRVPFIAPQRALQGVPT